MPFHPDESTQIFMSVDIHQFLQNPANLFWQETATDPVRQKYRELDAPLTRYIIEIGRTTKALDASKSDWNWSKDWDYNAANGALPSDLLLQIARISVAIFYPFCLLLVFLIVKSLHSYYPAFFAMIIFSLNPLVLLHTRRSMSESILLFISLLSIWSFVEIKQRKILTAIPAGLAFCAKQTALPLFITGFINIAFFPENGIKIMRRFFGVVGYIAIYAAVFILLNPFTWEHPIKAIDSSMNNRLFLATEQSKTYNKELAEQPWVSIPVHIGKAIYNMFFEQAKIEDVGNYSRELLAPTITYFSNPHNNLSGGWIGGAVLLILTITGFLITLIRIIRHKLEHPRLMILLLLSTIVQISFLLAMPTFFQRYFILMVPYNCIWAASTLAYFFPKNKGI